MRWSELSNLDGEEPLWEIPGSRTKNKRAHLVPLASLPLSIIAELPQQHKSDLIFTTTGSTPMSGFGKVKERVDTWIARKRKAEGKKPMPEWDLHDLRRTMVTMMNDRLRVSPHVVEACVNHISGGAKAGVAGVYNKAVYLDERREALTKWAGFVDGLMHR
jgi:integrase